MSSELLEEFNSRFLMEAKEAIGFVLLELECMDVPTHLHEPSSNSGDQWQAEPGPTVLPYCVIYSLPWLPAPLSLVLLLGGIWKDMQALCLSTVKPSYPSCVLCGSPCQCCVKTNSPPRDRYWEDVLDGHGHSEAASGMEWEGEESQLSCPNGDLALWVQGDKEIVGGEEAGTLDATASGRKGLLVPRWHQRYLAAFDRHVLSKTYKNRQCSVLL